MNMNSRQGIVKRISQVLTSSVAGAVVILLLMGPVHADALLGVIGYHIVPMQIENDEGQQEEESDDDTSDSDQTTVAHNTTSYRELSNKFSSVTHADYFSRSDQLLEM